MRESRIQYLCDPQWFRDTASRGPTTIVPPESQFRTCPSDHDSIGYPRKSASGESSTTMHRLLHASGSHPIPPPNDPKDTASHGPTTIVAPESQSGPAQRIMYGPFNPYIPIRSTTIGKSRVAIDPIAMHTSWRSNSDIKSVTSIGYPRMSASGESSTTMHRLLHASGSHPIPTPYDPKPVLRDANFLDTVVQRAPVFLLTDTSTQEDPIVQMDIDQYPDSPPTSADSSLHFNANDIPTEEDSTNDQLILPFTATPTTTDITTSFAQLRTLIDQVQFEQIRRKDDMDKLKDILLMHIRDLEKHFSDCFDQQDMAYRKRISTQVVAVATGLTDVQKYVQDTKDDFFHQLLDFRAQAQENYNNLTTLLGELVDYINRGGNDKKGEESVR
ncbi:hypothetical protein F511_08318 [Dorcoceras hygrometricum]|uniref:Uncharacterized protein n=1 Tax=Dorcoceras hygrometricum TaxID=472368 RepID=A0A2Z7B4M3_9LAMI|nr:hypothetical protein F511_08318 [Dorcoceras hygrometricum]